MLRLTQAALIVEHDRVSKRFGSTRDIPKGDR
jgi:hypothetical protein